MGLVFINKRGWGWFFIKKGFDRGVTKKILIRDLSKNNKKSDRNIEKVRVVILIIKKRLDRDFLKKKKIVTDC